MSNFHRTLKNLPLHGIKSATNTFEKAKQARAKRAFKRPLQQRLQTKANELRTLLILLICTYEWQ